MQAPWATGATARPPATIASSAGPPDDAAATAPTNFEHAGWNFCARKGPILSTAETDRLLPFHRVKGGWGSPTLESSCDPCGVAPGSALDCCTHKNERAIMSSPQLTQWLGAGGPRSWG